MPEFKRRERKHKKLARPKDEPVPSISNKKKRLDKYITTKLKKQENLELLKKLASRKVDTSLLQSSKDLGKQTISRKDVLARALRNQRAGIAGENDLLLLYEPARQSNLVGEPSSALRLPIEAHRQASTNFAATKAAETSKDETSFVERTSTVIGGGLKRPLERDHSGKPIIRKRQRLNRPLVPEVVEDQLSWDSVDSGSNSDTSQSDSNEDSNDTDSEHDSEDGSYSDESNDIAASYPLFAIPKTSQPELVRIKPRAQSDFKTWAIQQINEARDFTPSLPATTESRGPGMQLKLHQLRPKEEDPLPAELQVKLEPSLRQVHSVHVERTEAINESRLKLPIIAEEQKIMEAIHNNSIVVVCGATGSGKTTQVPQFLYEAGYGDPKGPTPGLIGVTQPRRVAAVTMAKRVGEELGAASKSAYQIRFDSSIKADTAIKFMTDGILIREISNDFTLTKYSAIIIDEAHERSVNTDILIGMLSRIIELRGKLSQTDEAIKPLKLIIMSATLMTDSFLNNPRLFSQGTPPLVESEGRQYPVTTHFSRRTRQDYIEEAYQKIVKGHKKLPAGGMLVFLTGQNEINDLVKKLRASLQGQLIAQNTARVKMNAREAPLESDDVDLAEQLADNLGLSDAESGDEDEEQEFDLENGESPSLKALVLPLYSQLPTKEQLKVFEPTDPDTRLIILATNIAETSITIPGIRYVFDCGRSKEKKYNAITGVQSFEIAWISKASALQRAGRAGRTGPGHCYRLYSSAMYERDFPDHTEPEILRTPIEGIILQLKSMDLNNTTNFPFPTAPPVESMVKAEKLLSSLGALDKHGKVTDLGRDLSLFPISPRFAKMLAIGHQRDSIYLVTAMVAVLAVPELTVPRARAEVRANDDANDDVFEDEAKQHRSKAYNEAQAVFSQHDTTSDAVKLSMALCAYMWAEEPESFCEKMFLQSKAMREAQRLYSQLLHIIALNMPGIVDAKKTKLQPPDSTQVAVLKQVVAAGFLDQVAIRADLAPSPQDVPRKSSRSINVPYLTLFPTHIGRTEDTTSQLVYVHPSSIMAHTTSAKNMPQYLIYSHIQRGNTATIEGPKEAKNWMYPLTSVTGKQLASLAKNTILLEYGKPIGKVETVDGSSNERIAWVVPSLIGERGGRAWPLPAVKTVQSKDSKGVWQVEQVLR